MAVAVGAAAAFVLSALAASGTPAWADTGTPGWYGLGYQNPAGAPALAADGAGDAFAAYALQDPQATGFPGYVVYVTERAAGSGTELGTPVPVSAMGTDDSSLYPSIAADAAGDVVVAWYDDGVIYAATRAAAAATFSSPITVSDPDWLADPYGLPVSVAMDAAGDAVVVWPETGNGTDVEHGDILVGAMRPVGASFDAASFGAAQKIYDPTGDFVNLVSPTSVAMGGGEAVIAYSASTVAYASTWSATAAAPSSPTNLGGTYCPGAATSIYCSNPVVAVDSDGAAIAALESSDENPEHDTVGVTTLVVNSSAGADWSGATKVVSGLSGSGPVAPIAVAVSPNGHAALAWNQTTGSTNADVTAEVAVGSSPGALGSPIALDQPTSYLATLGVDDQGAVLTTWTGSVYSTTLEASLLPAGSSTWGNPTEPPDQGVGASRPVQLTLADGNTLLAFAQPVVNGVGGAALVLDGFDTTGPTGVQLSVPATSVAHTSVAMSIAVADDFAGIDPVDVTWDFGDGQTGSGFAPHHTYLATGPYTVSVTAVDAAGFSASASAPLTITPAVLTAATPTITGTVKVGSKLTAHPGAWTSGSTFSYRWFAGSTAINGASKSTLVLAAAQLGKTITVRVTGTQTGYTAVSKTSKPTAKVAAGTLSGATPTITGTAKVGRTLTAHPGQWHPGPVKLAYRWYANGTAIANATHATLGVGSGLKGKKITVHVTGTKAGYRTLTKTSKATAAVTR